MAAAGPAGLAINRHQKILGGGLNLVVRQAQRGAYVGLWL